MALWAKVQSLPDEALRHVRNAYGVHFPIEVRHHFAQWIETQPWSVCRNCLCFVSIPRYRVTFQMGVNLMLDFFPTILISQVNKPIGGRGGGQVTPTYFLLRI